MLNALRELIMGTSGEANLKPARPQRCQPEYNDDIQVLDTFIVPYKEGDKEYMRYIMFCLRLKDDAGQWVTLWKAVRLLRVWRIPFQLRESEKIMDIHDDFIAGLWGNGINYITLVANILKPEPLGLLYCYGIQTVATTMEEAQRQADLDFAALQAGLQASYRGMEFHPLTAQEAEWLRSKMASMKKLLMLRGIPDAKRSPGESTQTSVTGMDPNPGTEEQMEEFIRGMADREFVFLVIASPVEASYLSRWLTVTSNDMSRWKSQMSGSKVITAGVSMPIMFMSNLGASQGWNRNFTDSETVGQSYTHTEGEGRADTVTLTEGMTSGRSVGLSEGVGRTDSASHSITDSHSVGVSHTETHTKGQSLTFTEGESMSRSVGVSEGINHSVGVSETDTVSRNHSDSETFTQGEGYARSHGETVGSTHSRGVSETDTVSHNVGRSHQVSQQNTVSSSVTTGRSHTENFSQTHTEGISRSRTDSSGWNFGGSGGLNVGSSTIAPVHVGGSIGLNAGINRGEAVTNGHNQSDAVTRGYADSVTTSHTTGVSRSSGVTDGINESIGRSRAIGVNEQWGESFARSNQETFSTQRSHSVGTTDTVGVSHAIGRSEQFGESLSRSLQDTYGIQRSRSVGFNESHSVSDGVTDTVGRSVGDTRGVALSQQRGLSVVDTMSQSQSVSRGVTRSTQVSDAISQQFARTQGVGHGVTGTTTQGASSSLSLGPFISMSKSFQWYDVNIENLVNLMDFQRQRLFKALQGQGAMYTDVYIFVEDEEAKRAASVAAKGAFYGDVLPTPLEVMDLSPEEEAHQAYHGSVFSACTAREGIPGIIESFRYSTILLAKELVAYTHPIRIEVGGPASNVENIPVLRVPTNRKGEIYHGKIVSGDRWTPGKGYITDFSWRISKEELMHTLFVGQSRSGKTVGATRFVAEIANNVFYGLDEQGRPRRLSIVALDWKKDWRILKAFVPEDKFRFYSLGDPYLNPIKMNLLAVPKNVYTQRWVDTVVETFCLGFSLGGRAKSILWQHLTDLYRKVDAFRYPERSRQVTMYDLWKSVYETKMDMDSPKPKMGKVGNDVRDAYARVLDRLVYFEWGLLHDLFCHKGDDAVTIDDLAKMGGYVTVLEGAGLDSEQKNFIIGVIAAGIYQYCIHNNGFDPGMLLIFEEAHQVLRGAGSENPQDNTALNIKETIYEIMFAEAAGWNLYLVAISQQPSKMPESVLANCSILYAYRMEIEEDVKAIVKKIGRDERYDHRDIARWFTRQPIGWCVARSSRVKDYKDSEPCIVATDMLKVAKPSDDDLRQWTIEGPVS
jgi:hypothetical protein